MKSVTMQCSFLITGCPVGDDKSRLSSLSLTKLQLKKTGSQENTGRGKLTIAFSKTKAGTDRLCCSLSDLNKCVSFIYIKLVHASTLHAKHKKIYIY